MYQNVQVAWAGVEASQRINAMHNVHLLVTSALQEKLLAQSSAMLNMLRHHHAKIVTAESCTGGLVAAALTHHAGSSDVTEGGFVTYSNRMKQVVLGVRDATLLQFGAVSAETVEEMAEGALHMSPDATLAVSVSGIAGPSGGSEAKPVGLVWFATAVRNGATISDAQNFAGDRTQIRTLAALHALELAAKRLETE